MTVQEAIDVFEKPSDHIKTIQINHVTGIVYSADLVKAFEMAIKALEKQISVEKALERLERLREYEETGDCPKDGMCDGGNCDTCYMDTAIQIIKEECDINATQNGSETRHSETNCRNMEHIQKRFERVM